ncbi:Stomatin [uncultured archaeon]|nr:Stomatin [uncultured archaeon]
MADAALIDIGGMTTIIISAGIILLAALLGYKSIYIVRPFERGIIERFGKYNRATGPGLALLLPYAERIQRVDMRESLIDIPPQDVITKDNVKIMVDAIVYFRVTDPFKVVYNVSVFEDAVAKLALTNLRQLVGSLSLDETLTLRERMNTALRQQLDDVANRWGVQITRVELEHIEPPKDITEAMGMQMKAERTKRAAVLEAEGYRQSEILKAEGKRQADMLDADGRAHAIRKIADAERYKQVTLAQGESEAIQSVFKGIHEGKATEDVLAFKYIGALEKIAEGKATKVFMPLELTRLMSGVEAIREAVTDGKNKEEKHTHKEEEKKDV